MGMKNVRCAENIFRQQLCKQHARESVMQISFAGAKVLFNED